MEGLQDPLDQVNKETHLQPKHTIHNHMKHRLRSDPSLSIRLTDVYNLEPF